MLAHHVFPISEVAGCARQSSSEDRAAGGNAAPRSTIDPSDRIVRVSERQSSADGVCYCEACCCMHVCVNVGPLPAVRRDVVDDDVVRSCRARHRRAPALRVRETELFVYYANTAVPDECQCGVASTRSATARIQESQRQPSASAHFRSPAHPVTTSRRSDTPRKGHPLPHTVISKCESPRAPLVQMLELTSVPLLLLLGSHEPGSAFAAPPFHHKLCDRACIVLARGLPQRPVSGNVFPRPCLVMPRLYQSSRRCPCRTWHPDVVVAQLYRATRLSAD